MKHQDIIDDCTNLKINSILIGELDLWYTWTLSTTLAPWNLRKTNPIDLYFNVNPDVYNILCINCNGKRVIFIATLFKNISKKFNGQKHLNDLTLLNTHRDMNVKIDNVIDKQAKITNRKMNITLWISSMFKIYIYYITNCKISMFNLKNLF